MAMPSLPYEGQVLFVTRAKGATGVVSRWVFVNLVQCARQNMTIGESLLGQETGQG